MKKMEKTYLWPKRCPLIGHENAHAQMSAFLAIIPAIFTKLLQLKWSETDNFGTVTVSPLLLMMRSLGAVFHRL